MASDSETVAKIVDEMREITFGEEQCPECGADFQRTNRWKNYAGRIDAAHRREVAGLRDALKKAYGTLYSISCSRYGEGLTCTDDIHELVTMARECSDELYADENLRKALEGTN